MGRRREKEYKGERMGRKRQKVGVNKKRVGLGGVSGGSWGEHDKIHCIKFMKNG